MHFLSVITPVSAQILFTDETCIEVTPRKSQYVRRGRGQPPHLRHILQTTKFPTKVLFWGCFSRYGVGPLHACVGTMDSRAYVDVIDQHLLPHAMTTFGAQDWYLLQDKATCHTSRLSMGHLIKNGVQVQDWPANSPDLNPIENL